MKTKLIIIEGKQIGIVGLDEISEELYQARRKPDESLKDYLLSRLKELNYIPSAKEEAYASVFLQEYKGFCECKEGKVEKKGENLSTWQGIPREQIPWFPTIFEDLCDGCKACLKFCSFGVYEYDESTNKVRVTDPFKCLVGCSICVSKCKPGAIKFPPLGILDTFRKR